MITKYNRYIKITLLVCLLNIKTIPLLGLTFNFNDITPGGISTDALNGFNAAGDIWSSTVTDNVTVNIDISFEPLTTSSLASASSELLSLSYTSVKSALATDQTSSIDALSVFNLPSGSDLTFRTQDSSGTIITDNNGSGNNTHLAVNRANAKALGLLSGSDTAKDALIKFDSDFTFDFDRSDGIASNAFDFIGVAIHEIGHALGFTSGVSSVDSSFGSGPNAPRDLNSFAVFSVLDLFRFSDDSVALGSGILDLAAGGSPYLSIEGGASNIVPRIPFATGTYNGDGHQASHWANFAGLGIMDPNSDEGENPNLTDIDKGAFDIIGWDLAVVVVPPSVPEPAESALVFGLVIVLLIISYQKILSIK